MQKLNWPTPSATTYQPRLTWPGWWEAHPRLTLGLMVMLMLFLGGLRLQLDPPSYESGQTDNWWSVAVNLIEGRGYAACFPRYFPFCSPTNQVTAMREPLPVFLFTAVVFLSQRSFWAAAGVELALSIGVLLALYTLVREWAGNVRVALFAALLWALYLPALKLAPQVSGDLLATLMLTLSLWLFVRAQQTHHARYWLSAGLGLGLAALSRSALIMLALPLLLGVWLTFGFTWAGLRQALRPGLIFGLALALTIAPWLIRTTLAFNQPVLGSTLTGYNLYRHNYMLSTDNYLRYVGADEAAQVIQALITQHPELRGNETEAQMDTLYRAEAWRIIRAYPLKYLALSLYRFLPLWFNWEVREAYGLRSGEVDYLMMAQQAGLLILALFGVRQIGWRRAWPLVGCVSILSLAYMLVNSQMRYLTPVAPLVIGLSATGGAYLSGLQKTLSTFPPGNPNEGVQ